MCVACVYPGAQEKDKLLPTKSMMHDEVMKTTHALNKQYYYKHTVYYLSLKQFIFKPGISNHTYTS